MNVVTVGHEEVQQRFLHSAQKGRLASTFLFVGPAGVGKQTFARQLASFLLCEQPHKGRLESCGQCPACAQVFANSHPDLLTVRRRADKNRLVIEQFVGDQEKRGREGLCHDLYLKPFAGGRKIAIIDDADYLNVESANALLKTLEEPPPQAIIILIATSEQRQLPTIRSRCQVIRFGLLTTDQVESILRQQQLLSDPDAIAVAARCSAGSVATAIQMGDPETVEFRLAWLEYLGNTERGDEKFSTTLSSFVDAAGKEAAQRRERLRLVNEMAIGFYQQLLQSFSPDPSDRELDRNLVNAMTAAKDAGQNPESVVQCLERCFSVFDQIHANANQTSLIENWLIDLGRASRKEFLFQEW